MSRPALFDHHSDGSAIVAWLILGYLSSNPDAKDTAEGVEKWWLNVMEVNMDAKTVQGSLDHLVKWGWLVSYQLQGTGVVYGLNRERREKLRQILQLPAD